MSDTGFIIQQINESDCQLLVPLMKDCFGMEVSNDYFKWKYFDNTAGNCVGFIAIERKTNKAISFYGAIPQKFADNGKEITVYQACDTMTHTLYRKKGLYPILARECYEYLKDQNNFFLIGIGGTEQSFPVLKHFGWRTIFNFRVYFKPNILCKLSLFRKYSADSFVTENSMSALEELLSDQTTASESDSYRMKSPRSLSHYKWRISNPNYNYKIVSYRNKGALQGFVVYYVHNNKITLFDFIFSNAVSRRALIYFLSKLVTKNGYKGIVAFCKEQGVHSQQLKRSLFISNPFNKGPLSGKSPFLIYSDEDTMEKYANPDKWSVTAYDYDAL
jgi:hypothetical protein